MPAGATLRRPRGAGLLRKVVAAVALLAMAENALAVNILRRRSSGGGLASDANAAAAAAAAARAEAAARQAESPLRRALDAIQGRRAEQDAARAAALAAPGAVPDGLQPGGLEVAPGAAPGSPLWQGADGPTQSAEGGRIDVTVTQSAPKAILTWTTFNVGRDTDLYFDQSAGGDEASRWIALNRVAADAAPSRILGSIRAEGQVYVVNRNGIIFGGSSQVNVATLVASGMEIAGGDARFMAGILSQPGVTFGGGGVPAGAVAVEPGARIEVGGYGQILLLGTQVLNRGSLEAPDGQVLLAAGSAISLSRAGDLRGYAVSVTGAGPVENGGIVSTPRGGIVLVGGDIRQNGLLTATTGAEASGSILLGQDGLPAPVSFGPGSRTQVLPDEGGGKVLGSTTLAQRSRIDASGHQITVLGDATLYAPSGEIALNADGRVYVESGARIDVSGLRDVLVPMEQNTIEAQLRANELRDNPVLRDNPALRGRSVYFDARLGMNPRSPVADVSGYYGLVERDVSQLMTTGGSLTLAGDEIITRAGSVLDLSGGSLRYLDGSVRSTWLLDSAGNRVRIENALAGVPYVGIAGDFVVQHPRWGITETWASSLAGSRPRFEAGYVQGSAAGRLTVGAAAGSGLPLDVTIDPLATGAYRIFDGEVVATTVVGPRQRDLPTGSSDPTRAWRERPAGVALTVNRSGDLSIADVGVQLGSDFRSDGPLDPARKYQHVLPASWFDGSRFTSVAIESGYTDDATQISPIATTDYAPGGHLVLGAGVVVDLGDGGSFSFKGKGADIDGTLRAPGGSVSIRALDVAGTVRLGPTGTIDVAGRLTNDHVDGATAPLRPLDGGKVSLLGREVVLEQGSLVDVAGGGRLDTTGSKLAAGAGGSIALDVSQPSEIEKGQRPAFDGRLVLDGTLGGYAPGKGGTLRLATGYDVVIGDALPSGAGPSYRLFTPDFFTHGGFSSFTLVGERSVTVAAGAALEPSVETLVLAYDAADLAGGTRLDDVATRQVLPRELRAPMAIGLSTVPVRTIRTDATGAPAYSGDLVVGTGARIQMTPGSTVQLSSVDTLFVDGIVQAPGGRIDLTGRSGTDLGQTSINALGVPNVRLGPGARLLAPGYARIALDGAWVRRSVEAGGTISLSAPNEVLVDPEAVIDVSGIEGVADLTWAPAWLLHRSPYLEQKVAGGAGAIVISAGSGSVLAGTLRLAPGGEAGWGGSLSITGAAAVPMVVQAEAPTGFGVAGGPDGFGPDRRGLAPTVTVVAGRIDASGADDVALGVIKPGAQFQAANVIQFQGDVMLRARRSITLVSPMIGTDPGAPAGKVVLAAGSEGHAGYVQLVGGNLAQEPVLYAGDLGGDLTVRADLIDLTNSIWLGCATLSCTSGGFKTTRFVSSGDIRLSDHDAGGNASIHAGLFAEGALELQAAQVFPTRLLDPADPTLNPGFLVQSGSSITVTGNGNPAPVPMSFGERLTLRAPTIVQGGVLRAPQGQIWLDGGQNGTVTLLPGSTTSASLEGLTVPFGAVATGGAFAGYDTPGLGPQKSVRIEGGAVSVQRGAVIDVSGGGDLLGWSFVPGNGGSRDLLALPNTFAVLPSLGTAPAPAGGTGSLLDTSLRVGDSVFLQGVPGLPDGTYTLLPAHYALLPGGFLVQPLAGSFAFPLETAIRPDGATIASGYRTVGGTPIRTPGYSPFLVMSRDVIDKHEQVTGYSFDEVARALADGAGLVVRTPHDAGTAAFGASQSLTLDGTGRFGAGTGGLLGSLDISAPKIAVLGSGASAPDASYLTLDTQALQDFGAGSVLIGGARSAAQGGTALAVRASDVLVDTSGASPWTGPEIILAASGSVTVRDGSIVRAEGAASLDTSPLLVANADGTTDGALLRLSTGGRVGIVRTGATGVAGDLTIGKASLSADGSLTLDGSRSIALLPESVLAGRQFDVASVRVNLGDVPAGEPGTTLGTSTVQRLASSEDLLVRGYGSIHLYGDLSLGIRGGSGQATLRKLTFDTGLLQGHPGPAGSAVIVAGELVLRNSGAAASSAGATGTGTLVLEVDSLQLGPGDVRLAGYGVLLGRAGTIEAAGTGGLEFAGALSLATALVQTGSGASYGLSVDGDLALTRGPGAAGPADVKTFGGRLVLEGSTVLVDAPVVVPGGTFEARARGGTLSLGPGAAIDVGGRAVDFQDQVRFAPAGAIRLAASGDLSVAGGAVLDVSGSARGGDAGSIDLATGGLAVVRGDLRGGAAAGSRGGAFSLDAGSAGTTADLSALNALLEQDGFDASRQIRLRQQDLVLAAGERIRAHRVMLRSDAGRVTVAGEIAAAGTAETPDGGTIEIVAGNGLAVEGTARLDASAGATPQGGFVPSSGKVVLVAEGGRIDVAPGAVVDVAGGRQGGGSVVLRAPRDGADVAVDRLTGDIRGAREVVVQGVQGYQASTVDAALAGTMLGDASAWLLASAGAIQARLAAGNPGLPAIQVGAGMVVASAGDLSIQSDLSLGGTAGAGHLGFVAPGRIDVGAVVSDGFATAARDAPLLAGRSASFGFESGGDIRLAAGAMVRTGTGDISMRAGRDLVLADTTSVVYTAGMATPTASGFLGAPPGMPIGDFATLGGDIALRAGRDILAAFPAQSTSAWLFRYGQASWTGSASTSTTAQQTSWSVVHGNFEQGVGALGGGDVWVEAGRDVVQLQVAIPTTGHLTTPLGGVPTEGDLHLRGGGDLQLSAGRDVLGGLFMLGRGQADVRAGGRVVASDHLIGARTTDGGQVLGSSRTVAALFGLMDARARIVAGGDVDVEAVYDPMAQGQLGGTGGNLAGVTGSAFLGYTERTSLDATSLGGSIRYENDPWASVDLSAGRWLVRMAGASSAFGLQAGSLNSTFSRAPGTLRLAALDGGAYLTDRFSGNSQLTLGAAAGGTIEALAREDLHLLLSLSMENAPPDYRRGPLAPFATRGDAAVLGTVVSPGGATPIHSGDPSPARLYSLEGSVCAYRSGACQPDARSQVVQVSLPKPVDVYAGEDVLAGSYLVRQDGAAALSRIRAGRDVYDVVLQVSGEGSALLEAGRDVVEHVPASGSVASQTRGLVYSLGDRRAVDLYILAGTSGGVDYDAFADAYLDPANRQGVVRTYLPELAGYLSALGYGAMSDADRVAAFKALPVARREIFLDRVLFSELKETGIDYNDPANPRFHSYQRGFQARSLLFPTDPSTLATGQGGSVLLNGKPLETRAQADITVLAPYGRVAVGTEVVDSGGSGGIVTRRGGDIRIMADQNIDLFTSRVFTLEGGDITMWTSNGSITAGSGSRTSVFAVPLQYTMSNDGVVTIDAFGLATGAGIGVLDALQDAKERPRSRLDLIAPKGEVNAGDAGIRVLGDLNIAAQVVVGIENIKVSGSSAGVPKVEAPNTAALTTASQLSQAAAREGVGPDAQPRTAAADLPSIITVEVVGYETTDKPDAQGDETPEKRRRR